MIIKSVNPERLSFVVLIVTSVAGKVLLLFKPSRSVVGEHLWIGKEQTMKVDELRFDENENHGVAKDRETNDNAYRTPRLYVAGKTADLLKGGNSGSLEDFAKRFKSAASG